jgi:hypothetical protein
MRRALIFITIAISLVTVFVAAQDEVVATKSIHEIVTDGNRMGIYGFEAALIGNHCLFATVDDGLIVVKKIDLETKRSELVFQASDEKDTILFSMAVDQNNIVVITALHTYWHRNDKLRKFANPYRFSWAVLCNDELLAIGIAPPQRQQIKTFLRFDAEMRILEQKTVATADSPMPMSAHTASPIKGSKPDEWAWYQNTSNKLKNLEKILYEDQTLSAVLEKNLEYYAEQDKKRASIGVRLLILFALQESNSKNLYLATRETYNGEALLKLINDDGMKIVSLGDVVRIGDLLVIDAEKSIVRVSLERPDLKTIVIQDVDFSLVTNTKGEIEE